MINEDSSSKPKEGRPSPVPGYTGKPITLRLDRLTIKAQRATYTARFEPNTVALLLQTVVVPGDTTSEGQIIEAVALPWFDIIELLIRDPSMMYRIKPRKWEEIIAGVYWRAGFDEVTLTPSSGDHGRDVIAVKRGVGSVRVIDQVKAHKPGHVVKGNAVRALLGVLEGDRASNGFLTTTSDFAPQLRDDPLIKPFIPAKLELVNGEMLLARLKELAKNRP